MSKLEKAIKTLGNDFVAELEAMDGETLQKRVVQANESMRQAEEELEASEIYQETRENLKALTAGKREVNKRQKAIITLALNYLNGDKNGMV